MDLSSLKRDQESYILKLIRIYGPEKENEIRGLYIKRFDESSATIRINHEFLPMFIYKDINAYLKEKYPASTQNSVESNQTRTRRKRKGLVAKFASLFSMS